MTARLYVGTYAKYNSGSIFGKWLDLEDYSDKEAFLEACAKLHSDEEDPEFMFQDFEGFPESMYDESSVSDEIWEWLDLDEDDQNMLEAYQKSVDTKGTIEQAREEYRGKYDSPADYAERFHEEVGDLASVPDSLRYHIDWESVAHEMQIAGVSFVKMNGEFYVFG